MQGTGQLFAAVLGNARFALARCSDSESFLFVLTLSMWEHFTWIAALNVFALTHAWSFDFCKGETL